MSTPATLPVSSLLRELLVLNANTGQCLYTIKSSKKPPVDEGLFSAFISAVFSFTQELGSDKLEQLRMGDKEIYLEKVGDYIFVADAEEDAKPRYLTAVLSSMSELFVEMVHSQGLEPTSMRFLTDLKATGFDTNLLKNIGEVGKQHLGLTAEERAVKAEKLIVSVLGRSLGENIMSDARDSSKIRSVNESNIDQFFGAIETVLVKRMNQRQANQLMKKIRAVR